MVEPRTPPCDSTHPWLGAVVLTGGTGSRLGGADKASLVLGGETLLSRALAAAQAAAEVVVVGDPAPTDRPVVWTREDPPGGGPAAGLLAGVDRLSPGCALVVALAVDMPRVSPQTVARLVAAMVPACPGRDGDANGDGAVLVDGTGHRQPLCAVYRRESLARVRPPDTAEGLSMRRLVAALRLVEVPAEGAEASDVDTWADLERLGGRPPARDRRGTGDERRRPAR